VFNNDMLKNLPRISDCKCTSFFFICNIKIDFFLFFTEFLKKTTGI
jgi:hypothetical protein